jgi:hypothetical protein
MAAKSDADLWGRIIRFSWNELTSAEARGILRLKFKREDVDRAYKLGLLAQEGSLTPSQRAELERYVHVGRVLSIMHSHARRSLRSAREPSARRKAS